MTLFKQFEEDRARARASRAGEPESLLTAVELRISRSRGVLAEPSQHSEARVRRACRSLIRLLPYTPEHHDERQDAQRMLELLNAGAPV